MANSITPKIEPSWAKALESEFQQDYFAGIKTKLLEEKTQSKTIYPPGPLIFNAFNLTPFDQVKVVIIGQDPYHGAGQAHGLCFSVQRGVKPPPSLVNIFKEINQDLGIPIPNHGCLENWAKQGVLLLNAILTVRAGEPASHNSFGWQEFTNAAIKALSDKRESLVFLLWGRYAQEKEILIDTEKHYVLKTAHPSPFSATKFFGCKHFSKTNELLKKHGKAPIDWHLD
ncbi:MAG: uracil-DNA glycosylase [Chitinophagales bacterium]|nr:uracil-DNA glycosylase [Chitinophagales bacterium]